MLKIKVISAHPEMFPGTLGYSIIGKALKEKKFMLEVINLHDFGIDNRKTIDDEPFGGGPGMILRPDVVEKALLSINSEAKKDKILRIFLTPSGKTLNQKKLTEYSKLEELIIPMQLIPLHLMLFNCFAKQKEYSQLLNLHLPWLKQLS